MHPSFPLPQTLNLDLEHCAFAPRELSYLHLDGDDALSWLQGQVTQDLHSLEEQGSAKYALLLGRNGRIVSDLWVRKTTAGVGVTLPKSAVATLSTRVEHHVVMEDVDLKISDARVYSIVGPRALTMARAYQAELEKVVREVATHSAATGSVALAERAASDSVLLSPVERLGHHACDLIVPAHLAEPLAKMLQSASEPPSVRSHHTDPPIACVWLDDESLDQAYFTYGEPRFERDFGTGQLPQEAGLARRAVSFDKGCYLGQEAVVMLEHRGKLSRRLARLTVDQDHRSGASGAELAAPAIAAGEKLFLSALPQADNPGPIEAGPIEATGPEVGQPEVGQIACLYRSAENPLPYAASAMLKVRSIETQGRSCDKALCLRSESGALLRFLDFYH